MFLSFRYFFNSICLFILLYILEVHKCSEDNPCQNGNGTCSNHEECIEYCSFDTGDTSSCNSDYGLFSPAARCCKKLPGCLNATSNNGCCTTQTPCALGDGDCDYDSECEAGLVCGINNCEQASGNYPAEYDCCTTP